MINGSGVNQAPEISTGAFKIRMGFWGILLFL